MYNDGACHEYLSCACLQITGQVVCGCMFGGVLIVRQFVCVR